VDFFAAKIIALRVQADQCNARIAAMQAANEEHSCRGFHPAYSEKEFMEEANELGGISVSIEELAHKIT
jgi:hypothetical protein